MREQQTPDPRANTSLTLLALIQQGDGEAWRKLVLEYGPLVQEWCDQSGVPSQDAADVVQEVLQSVSRSVDRFHRDQPGDSFRKWLRTITANQVRDYYRRAKRTPMVRGGTTAMLRMQHEPDPFAGGRPGDAASTEPTLVSAAIPNVLVERVRQQVKPQTWDAFWLTVVEDRPPADVARELKISVWSVYQARSRVLARFRREAGDTAGRG